MTQMRGIISACLPNAPFECYNQCGPPNAVLIRACIGREESKARPRALQSFYYCLLLILPLGNYKWKNLIEELDPSMVKG